MDKIETIKQFTQELLDKMVDKAEVEVVDEDGIFHVNIKTDEDAPTVIGRHGETIRAIQKIIEVMLFKAIQERVNVLINVNDYREKQIERLQYIADQAVEKVKERNTATYLRGFSSYERRVMHEHVGKQYPELTSYSIGEGRDRRLVLDLKKEGEEHNSEEHQESEE
ncbi:MAG: Single-stranded nucleic acid binding R3H [Candidatus Roizmanbacteria bacterium GW2011_GWA2_37_7]|uniref:Single-stranded nucleic acid binding R3H n=1 Tax=Candidatus Roizmanbacteria bacterium GW2011_GWA2_37_7 TaxID=1618481 RepID=A0A0G0KBM5_9BACT|nr:MAG: Single-stranded nucleic acid binding R3H [Candidatus Roizmanbacteria bacterium GW2011_GWA2_37_7]